MADETPPFYRRRKLFPPCQGCGDDPGFTWTCPCGFALCTPCMAAQAERCKANGRSWTCPVCQRTHVGPAR
ncbi:MAG: hypothetical protein GW824_09420 [Deltaproteobacteria bacterium]|nr:hypothetical protein [Deltaproteobacteria bacterium]PIU78287.1 MAG: hypothetical protein COS73_07445 [Nitrospirae bacterium CG06_land_8_20_14_3_00_70_43]PJB94854.1 MAG: hypothetical protein CO080_10785 [Nitrospirae bacterium CG_4_9_14_0_8_um_filter_70_14]